MLAIIILAAGRSRRMGMPTSKVVLNLAGRPVVDYINNAVLGLNPTQTIYVISPELKYHEVFFKKEICVQEKPLGTGHAVKEAIKQIKGDITHVMVLCGDTPLIQTKNLIPLTKTDANLTVLAMRPPEGDNAAYGKLKINNNGQLQAIIEHKDASADDLNLPLANTGCFMFKRSFLEANLSELNNNNAAGEIYLTDLVKIGHSKGVHMTFAETEHAAMQGFNTPQEFVKITEDLQNRWRTNFLAKGVILHQPQSITFSYDTKIEPLAEVGPFVNFGTGVSVSEKAKILSFCHIENSTVKTEASVGPFAHLRGKAIIDHHAAIGNFVEVKGSHIKPHAKAKHLSYIGDAIVGEKTNIGAGTITCNYDGFKKYKTEIAGSVMIGANSTLIAPIKIGKGAYIAAGSVIQNEVPSDSLTIARAEQKNKEGGASRIRVLKSKK